MGTRINSFILFLQPMLKETLACTSIDELDATAEKIIDAIGGHNVIAFYGRMGVGKTTLIKTMCKKLGVVDRVSSPTFSIVNEYLTSENKIIYHFDFYRIKSEEEAMDLGYENYFYSGDLCLIEWSEKIPNLLSLPHAKILIDSKSETP